MIISEKSWCDSFPNGRYVYYEGDDREGFIEEMKTKFGFDPSADERWNAEHDWCFHLPGHLMTIVYGNPRYQLGS